MARTTDPAPTRRPPVDWTGHVYKAVKELTVPHYRRGRESATGGKKSFFRPERTNT